MSSKHLLTTLCTTLCTTLSLTGATLAQGSDSCASAQVIAGTGLFAFDNTNATIDGTPDPLCSFFGQQDVDHDVWFSWVAPSDGIFTVETCGLTAVDTKIGIYDGSCAGVVLACGDDACGSLQTSLSWSGTGGNTYLIRLGTFPGALGGTGQFDLREEVPALNPANGHRYMVVDQALSWDAANAAAQATIYSGTPGHLVTIGDQAELDWMLANLIFSRPWIGLFHDTQSPNYQEPDLGWAWVTGEAVNFLNWASTEPNNNSGSGGAEDYCEMFGNGEWNDAELNHLATIQYIIEFEGGPVGTPYCADSAYTCPCFVVSAPGEGCPNSTGPGATLTAAGVPSIGASTFSLTAAQLPDTVGLFVQGSNAIGGADGNPVGEGRLCLSPQKRYQPQAIAGGTVSRSNFENFATAGNALNYQFWYRDPSNTCAGGGFNFGPAYNINWLP